MTQTSTRSYATQLERFASDWLFTLTTRRLLPTFRSASSARSYRPGTFFASRRQSSPRHRFGRTSRQCRDIARGSSSSSKHGLIWAASCAALLLIACAVGFRLWTHSRSDPEARFWAPILSRKTPTILSVGGVTFSAQSSTGTQVASDQSERQSLYLFRKRARHGAGSIAAQFAWW